MLHRLVATSTLHAAMRTAAPGAWADRERSTRLPVKSVLTPTVGLHHSPSCESAFALGGPDLERE